MKDFDILTDVIAREGGVLHASANVEVEKTPVLVCLWEIRGNGVISTSYEDGQFGLYQFVGEDDAPVEDDIKFIEGLKQK